MSTKGENQEGNYKYKFIYFIIYLYLGFLISKKKIQRMQFIKMGGGGGERRKTRREKKNQFFSQIKKTQKTPTIKTHLAFHMSPKNTDRQKSPASNKCDKD